MLLVDKLNKGKLPEKPDKGESAPVPGLSSLVVKPQNIAARIANVDAIKRTIHERLIAALGQNSDAVSSDVIQRRIDSLGLPRTVNVLELAAEPYGMSALMARYCFDKIHLATFPRHPPGRRSGGSARPAACRG